MPDFILCRALDPVKDNIKNTISVVCSLPKERIISAPDVKSIYDLPVDFEKENLGAVILKVVGLPPKNKDLRDWVKLSDRIKKIKNKVVIGIVGKYFNFKSCRDTYISVIESINHASWFNDVKPEILWLDAEKYEKDKNYLSELNQVDGIIVPGGFGERGIEGMILAAEYARKNKIPYFGLCLGMQIMVIELARHELKFKDANSTEFFQNTKHPVICTMAEQKINIKNKNYGGSMRLGANKAILKLDSLAFKAYGQKSISERHRHRYEFNNQYRTDFEKVGFKITGINPDRDLAEVVEIFDHPWMIGVQFHPEFKSRPLWPHPLFRDFIKVCVRNKTKK